MLSGGELSFGQIFNLQNLVYKINYYLYQLVLKDFFGKINS